MLNQRRKSLGELYVALHDIYGQFHPDARITFSVLKPIIWYIIKIDPSIVEFYYTNSQIDPKELSGYGGHPCERILDEVERILLEDRLIS